MVSITAEYLIPFIERHVNRTIGIRRNHSIQEIMPESVYEATNEELADFILSIPYYDQKIKDFILGTSGEKTIIISQAWEIAFIVRAKKWAESEEWLQEAFPLSIDLQADPLKGNNDFLTLPY